MSQEIPYEFNGYRVDRLKGVLLLDGQPVDLSSKPFKLLVVLIENRGRFVTKEELMRLVWPGNHVSDGNFHVNLNKLRKAFGETAENPRFIFRTADGYQFVADVKTPGVLSIESHPRQWVDRSDPVYRKHLAHVLASCILYATLYASAVFLEIAYEFDRYGRGAFPLTVIVFGWIFVTSVLGLLVGQQKISRSGGVGLLVMVLFFFGAAFVTFAGMSRFLPNQPVTRAVFQTYPAEAAYLKDIVHFLVLGLLFMIFPFHFVSIMRREVQKGRYRAVLDALNRRRLAVLPRGAIYLRFGYLALLLVILALLSIAMTVHLLDNLQPGPYRNLFTQLVYLRAVLYFGLGIECLAWYYSALADLKRECISAR
jgi:DNA-binding winged helix-turn-helix (wHTH) protein